MGYSLSNINGSSDYKTSGLFEEITINYTIPGIIGKFKGGIKYRIQYNSKVVVEGMMEGKEITEEEFNNY